MLLAVMLALLALAVLHPSAAQAAAEPRVGCSQHIEGDGPPPRADAGRDVTRGALTLIGARPLQHHRVPLMRTRRARLGVMLDAGREATIAVAPESRDVAFLEYRLEGRRRVPEWLVTFRACSSATAGPRTVWAGGMRVRRPGCVTLQIRVDGAALDDVRIPLGRPCRPPAGTRPLGCAERSEGSFPDAWSDPANLVVGPLTVLGGAGAALRSAAGAIRETGGVTAPLLLREGSTAALSVAWEARRRARLRYGPGDATRALRLTACRHGQDSGSDVNTWPVTSWPGAIELARVPVCVPLDLWVAETLRRRLRIPFGDPGACT